MKLGYSPTTAAILNLDEAFKLAVELELHFVELAWELSEIVPQFQSEAQVRELSRTTGVTTTMHLPFVDLNIASLIPAARMVAVERVQRAIEFAVAVDSSCGVLHTGHNPLHHVPIREYARAALDQSLSTLAGSPLPLALENLALEPEGLLHGPQALLAVTKQHDLNNCLDFGHAHVEVGRPWHEPKQGEDLIQSYLDTLGNRIIHLHLHNNDGSDDQHLPTTEGTIPYHRYIAFLQRFTGTICLEIGGGAEQVRTSVRHLRTLAYGLA